MHDTEYADSGSLQIESRLASVCWQAAIDKVKAAQSKAPKRPTFRRPTAKRPAATAPAEEHAAAKAFKKPRLDALFQQSAAQPSLAHESGSVDNSDGPQAWSPTQHTDLPYSPGKLPMPCKALSHALLLDSVIKCLTPPFIIVAWQPQLQSHSVVSNLVCFGQAQAT